MLIFSKRLKELRKKANITQQQLGNLVGVTKVSICCYENGTRTPTLETLIDLANNLNTDIMYLLGTEKYVIAEDDKSCSINLAKSEIDLIKELRMHAKLYEKMIEDPKRVLDYYENKLR